MAAITFTHSKDGKATKLYDIFTSLTIARTWFDPKYLLGSCVADGDSQKVAVIVPVESRV